MLAGIKSFSREELAATFREWSLPAYRLDQVLQWLYQRRVDNWEAMTNLPREMRGRLQEQFSLAALSFLRTSGDREQTLKFLWQLTDRSLIESVLIPANPALYGEASDRHTLCISTQVGCAYGCKFCASGLEGWRRNLTVDEIVEQVVAVERWNDAETRTATKEQGRDTRLVDNLVVMGMGEPLANYDNLIKALAILNAPWGGGIGARKITVSTSGLAPQIRKLADEPWQFRLAISLHGTTDEVRSKIMPVNRKYPLAELTAACEYYLRQKDRMLTFEYILIAGVNDGREQLDHLIKLARKLRAKVNLIPYNKVEGLAWERPEMEVCERFLEGLQRAGMPATLRREKGGDIDAACGQLRLKVEKELGII